MTRIVDLPFVHSMTFSHKDVLDLLVGVPDVRQAEERLPDLYAGLGVRPAHPGSGPSTLVIPPAGAY